VSEVRGRRAKATDATVEAQGAVLEEQRRMLAELQTPVIQVWEGVLALPIVGSLDTARAQEMTEALLERIVQTGSEIVLLDITGVPVVDTSVAKHLLETVAAARLLGAEVLVVGLSTRTALTLVHLGIDLAGVTTRTSLAKGLELAFARLGLEVVRRREGRSGWAGRAEPGRPTPSAGDDPEAGEP
jgi:rsbT co-antagonist protein RsbR